MGMIRVGVVAALVFCSTALGNAQADVGQRAPFQSFFFFGTGEPGDETWIDRETLAYFLRGILSSQRGQELKYILDRCEGVRLLRRSWGTHAEVFFAEPIAWRFNSPSDAKRWELYGFSLPRTWAFDVSIQDGQVAVMGLDRRGERLELWVKLPLMPDKVLIRSVDGDLATGHVNLHLGAVWNTVAIEASARLLDKKFDGVDVWETVKENLWEILSPLAGIPVLYWQ